jgi:hypothetical protein
VGNVLRIVIGVAGLVGAGWSAVRTMRERRAGEETSHARTFAILAATAAGIALTLLL